MATVICAPVESEMFRLQLVKAVFGRAWGDVVGSWCHWFLSGRGGGHLRSCDKCRLFYFTSLPVVYNLKTKMYN